MGLYEFSFPEGSAKATGLRILRADARVLEIHDFVGELAWVPLMVPLGESHATLAEHLRELSRATSVRLVSTWDWPQPTAPATPLDMRILAAYAKDALRSSADVAKEVGVTAKTVRLRMKVLAKAHAFTVLPAINMAFVRGATAFVLAVELTPEAREQGHAALLATFPEALLCGSRREETTWLFLAVPSSADVGASLEKARSVAGVERARVLLVRALHGL